MSISRNRHWRIGGLVWLLLTQGKVTCVSRKLWPKVRGIRWRAIKSEETYYAVASVKRGKRWTTVQLHRLLKPSCQRVDHEDRDGLNNRSSNLRRATVAQNRVNCKVRKDSPHGIRGVEKLPNKANSWRARVGSKHVGVFPSLEKAALAYNAEAKKRWGKYAVMNKI